MLGAGVGAGASAAGKLEMTHQRPNARLPWRGSEFGTRHAMPHTPHGISTGDPLRSAPRPHNRPAHSLGRPERPLQAPNKSGKQKKIEFPHPTSCMYELRGYVYEVEIFARYSRQRRTAT